MKSILTLAAVLVAFSMAFATKIAALEIVSGDLTIAHPTARPNLPNRPTVAYMKISNGGETDDRLVSARSPAFGKIEFHTVIKNGEVMKMLQIVDIPVPAGHTAALEPGGLHLMLFDGAKLQKDGDMFPVTLTFETGGDVEIMVKVDRRAGQDRDHSGHGAKPKGHGDDHSDHKHGTKSE